MSRASASGGFKRKRSSCNCVTDLDRSEYVDGVMGVALCRAGSLIIKCSKFGKRDA